MSKKPTTAELVAEVHRRDDLAMGNAPRLEHPLRRQSDKTPPLTLEDLSQLKLCVKYGKHQGFRTIVVGLYHNNTKLSEDFVYLQDAARKEISDTDFS